MMGVCFESTFLAAVKSDKFRSGGNPMDRLGYVFGQSPISTQIKADKLERKMELHEFFISRAVVVGARGVGG